MRDRFLFITQQLIGYEVEVERTDGVWLTGVFHTAHTTTQHNFAIIIKMVPLTTLNTNHPHLEPVATLTANHEPMNR